MNPENERTLKQAEAILEACDFTKERPYLELAEIRVFLQGCREEPKGKEAELARVRVRVFELFKELTAEAAAARGWTQEEREAWAAEAEAGILADLRRRNAEIDAPRDYAVSWARAIEKRRGP
jgi:hypothetical protein